MFESHPDVKINPPDDAELWRYTDLAKFLALISSSRLTFASLTTMTDRWEGAYSGTRPSSVDPSTLVSVNDRMQRRYIRQTTFINCWHQAVEESMAMWELYRSSGEGVAIRTSWKRLKASITDPQAVVGGAVEYVDYAKNPVIPSTDVAPVLHKRLSYEHEREVRLIMLNPEDFSAVDLDMAEHFENASQASPVVSCAVDLSTLIEAVVIAPGVATWEVDLIRTLSSRLGSSAGVRHSRLDELPPS